MRDVFGRFVKGHPVKRSWFKRVPRLRRNCPICNRTYKTTEVQNKQTCSRRCGDRLAGQKRTKTGDKFLENEGYLRSTRKGNRYQHRIVMEAHIGRKLKTFEQVHHINHDKHDNRIENLELLTNSEHQRRHYLEGLTNRKCLRCKSNFQGWKSEYCSKNCRRYIWRKERKAKGLTYN